MSDINFDCPKCGQNLDAPGDLAGLFVECPSCGAIIKVPQASGGESDVHEAGPASGQPTFVQPPDREDDKGSTMRIDLPPDFQMPPPKQRKIIIKRPGR